MWDEYTQAELGKMANYTHNSILALYLHLQAVRILAQFGRLYGRARSPTANGVYRQIT